MSKFELVLFDFDGTIADSAEGILNCVEYALDKHNIPVGDRSRLNFFIGPPLYTSFNHLYGLEGEQCDEIVETYRERYNTQGVFEFTLYDGIVDLVKELKENGIKVGIASAKPRVFIHRMLEKSGIDNIFDTIEGTDLENHNADKTFIIKKAMKNMEIDDNDVVAMVGDRHYDINGAKKADVTSVGVLYGYGTQDELKDAGADYLAGNIEELKKILLDIE